MRLRALLPFRTRTTPPPSRRCQLRCETLEGREVPSANLMGVNLSGVEDWSYDRLFAEYSTTLDPEKSQSLLADMMKLAHEDVAAIPMYYAALGLAYRNVVVGPGAVAPNQAANAWNIHDWELKPGGA